MGILHLWEYVKRKRVAFTQENASNAEQRFVPPIVKKQQIVAVDGNMFVYGNQIGGEKIISMEEWNELRCQNDNIDYEIYGKILGGIENFVRDLKFVENNCVFLLLFDDRPPSA